MTTSRAVRIAAIVTFLIALLQPTAATELTKAFQQVAQDLAGTLPDDISPPLQVIVPAVTGVDSVMGRVYADRLAEALSAIMRSFTVLERREEHIQHALEDIKAERLDLFDQESRANFGRMTTAKAIVFAKMKKTSSGEQLTVWIYLVETSERLPTVYVEIPKEYGPNPDTGEDADIGAVVPKQLMMPWYIWIWEKFDANPWPFYAGVFMVALAISTALATGFLKFWNRKIGQENTKLRQDNRSLEKDNEILKKRVEEIGRELVYHGARVEELEKDLKLGSAEPAEWPAPQKSRVTWDKCEDNDLIHRLDAPSELPYIISFDIDPRYKDEREHGNLWRAGILFHDGSALYPQLLFHIGWEEEMHVWVHAYVGYPIVEKGVDLRSPLVRERMHTGSDRLRLQVVVREDRVVLRAGSRAWWFKEGKLGLEPSALRNPSLLAWCDSNVCDVEFRNIVVRHEKQWDANCMDDLCDATYQPPKITASFEYEFGSELKHAWAIPPSGWNPIFHRGEKFDRVQLPAHDSYPPPKRREEGDEALGDSDRRLLNVLLLDEIPYFVNGQIECEVYLQPGALFNVIFRGSLAEDEFYMARLDSRQNYRDCVLFKPQGKGWRAIGDDGRKHRTTAKKWIRMCVAADGPTVVLYNDEEEVYRVDEVETRPGRIGLFAEEKDVYVRKFKIHSL